MPELVALSAQRPADLVTCVVGTADVRGRPRGVEARLRALLAALPEGTVIATLPPVWSTRTSAALNAVVRSRKASSAVRSVARRSRNWTAAAWDL